ncbi:MAG: alpha/beta hydrolase [Gammaproteobacteria bacterium]|nr:alpha/beta hydrolase [Gammaproteobacteria bacterium]
MLRVLVKIVGVLLLIVIGSVAMLYIVDGQPRPETRAFLEGDGYTSTINDDGSLLFTPAQPNGRGLLILHGALIKPLSYANTAAYFAQRGYTVYLPYGGSVTRLPLAALESTAAWLAASPIDDWVAIGHSLGGMSTLMLVSDHPEAKVRAAALWAAGMPSDFSNLGLPVLYLWGDSDGILPQERFEDGKRYLPPDTQYETVAGANHRDFAMYTHQFFDRDGQLGWERQIAIANALTDEFFNAQATSSTAPL